MAEKSYKTQFLSLVLYRVTCITKY